MLLCSSDIFTGLYTREMFWILRKDVALSTFCRALVAVLEPKVIHLSIPVTKFRCCNYLSAAVMLWLCSKQTDTLQCNVSSCHQDRV
jgi:hypothetical protein